MFFFSFHAFVSALSRFHYCTIVVSLSLSVLSLYSVSAASIVKAMASSTDITTFYFYWVQYLVFMIFFIYETPAYPYFYEVSSFYLHRV